MANEDYFDDIPTNNNIPYYNSITNTIYWADRQREQVKAINDRIAKEYPNPSDLTSEKLLDIFYEELFGTKRRTEW